MAECHKDCYWETRDLDEVTQQIFGVIGIDFIDLW